MSNLLKNWTLEKYTGHPHYEIWGQYAEGSPQRVAFIQDHLAESEKIGKLIAATPELLEALKHVHDIINSYSHIPCMFNACLKIQEAIKKTE